MSFGDVKSSSDAVVSVEPLSNCDFSVSNGVEVRANLLDSKSVTLAMEPASDHDGGCDIVVKGLIDDVRVSGDEIEVVVETGEKLLDESSSDAIVSSVPVASIGVTIGVDSLELKTGTVTMEPSSDLREAGDIAVQDSVDDGRVSGDERTTVMENIEKVMDESSSDAVLSNSDIVVSKLGSENESLTMELSSVNDEGGVIAVHDSFDDSRVSGDKRTIVMENIEKVLDESSSDAIVSSVPPSNSDITVTNEDKIGADLLDSKTGTLTMQPFSDNDGVGGIVMHDSVDDARVFEEEKEIVMEKAEEVLDQSSSDVVVLSVPLSNSDIPASNEVKIGDDFLNLKSETLILEVASDHNGDGDNVVQDSVNDARISLDEREIVLENNEKVLDELSSDVLVTSVQPCNSDIAASDGVKADLLDSETVTIMMEPSDPEVGGDIAVQGSIDDVRVSVEEKEIVMENIEKVLKESRSDTVVLSVQPSNIDIPASNKVSDARVSSDKKEIVMENIEKVLDKNVVIDEEKEGKYKVTDLVWAKVRNYPWWPGQIFDPSASTDKAKKYSNKKGFLVAYFGDQTFAWNKASNIKPFRKNFHKMAKQGKSKAFYHAVNCALDEVSRRIEFGLACSCLSKEVYNNIKSQVFVNAGIKKEGNEIEGGDNFSTVSTFKPVNIVQSVQDLAGEHFDGVSRLEVLSVKTQLLAFFRWKGYNQLSAQQLLDGFDDKLEDKVVEDVKSASVSAKDSSKKRKLNACDNGDLLLDDKLDDKVVEDAKLASISVKVSSKKKKLNACDSGDSVPRKKEKSLKNETPKEKSTVKSKSKKNSGDLVLNDKLEDDKVVKDAKPASVSEVSFKKKKLKACESDDSVPRKKEKGLKNVTQKENSSVKSKSKKNSVKKLTIEGSGFKEKGGKATDDRKLSISRPKTLFKIGDTICRIAKQLSESPSILKKESKNDEKCVEKKESEKSKYDEKCVEKSKENAETSKENSATALILKFTNFDSIPSVTKLNEIFRSYGTVRETETEILMKNSCAKVVFDEQLNAESAFSSAGKFSVFGQSLISYRLDYSPTLRKFYSRNRKRNRKDMKSGETKHSEVETA